MARVLDADLQAKINAVHKSQKRIRKTLEKSKDDVKDKLVEGILKVMNSDDFVNNQGYLKFYKEYVDGLPKTEKPVAVMSRDKQKEWIKSLPLTNQIDILAEYSISPEYEQGENEWEKNLSYAQADKDVTKKGLVIDANEVIESYKQLLNDHKETIEDLRQEIKNDKKELIALQKSYATLQVDIKDKNAQKIVNTDQAADNLKKNIEELSNKIKDDEKKLKELEDQTELYDSAIKQAISELENFLKSQKIFVGRYEGLEKSESSSENTQNSTISSGASGGSQTRVDERDSKKIAKAILLDVRNVSSRELMQVIEHTGYGELVDMVKELGPLDRKEFLRKIENRLEDMSPELRSGFIEHIKDEEGNVIDTVMINESDLANLAKNDSMTFEKVQKLMKYYEANYEKLRVHERKNADKIMDVFKLYLLSTESKRNKFQRFIGRYTKKGSRLTELGNDLTRYAKEKGKLFDAKWERNQNIRDLLKIKTPVPQTTRKRHMDRSGTKSINMEIVD